MAFPIFENQMESIAKSVVNEVVLFFQEIMGIERFNLSPLRHTIKGLCLYKWYSEVAFPRFDISENKKKNDSVILYNKMFSDIIFHLFFSKLIFQPANNFWFLSNSVSGISITCIGSFLQKLIWELISSIK